MIKAVIFDIDNTIYNYDSCHAIAYQALAEYCRHSFSLEKDEYDTCYSQAGSIVIERVGTSTAAIHSRTLRFQCMMELLKQPLFPHVEKMYQIYWDTFLAQIVPHPGLLEVLSLLKSRHIRIGIGTDMTARIQYKKLEKSGAAPFIDFVVTSEEAGVEKPDPRFFSLCLAKARCRADECIFIGDNPIKDVKGALDFGMQGVLYTQGKEPPAAINTEYLISYEDWMKRPWENVLELSQ